MHATQFRFPPHPWIRAALLVGIPLLAYGCADHPPTEPGGEDLIGEPACQVCPLMVDAGPLNAAQLHSDSADVPVFLAEFRIRGERGDSINLVLQAAEGILEAIGPAQRISVDIDGATTEYALHELLAGVVVYEFGGRETIDVLYTMNRAVPRRIEGAITVTQAPTGAAILMARTPWAVLARPRILLQEQGSGCSGEIMAASGTICGINVEVTPFAVAEIEGATFQSGSGTGASSPISISLNPASSVTVTVTIVDPDFGGNSAVARNAAGAIVASASFAGDNMPGVPSSETAVLAADEIASVELTPAPEDYVAYTVTIGVVTDTCPPAGDSLGVLDDPAMRDSLLAAYERSNADSAFNATVPGTNPPKMVRNEQAGLIWQLVDGTLLFETVLDPNATPCRFDGNLLISAGQNPPEPNAQLLAFWHTHPNRKGERVYGCRNQSGQRYAQYPGDVGHTRQTGDHIKSGGGSRSDWNTTVTMGFPQYIIDKDGFVWRLDPTASTTTQQRNNPNQWNWKNPSVPGCITP